MAVNRRRGQPKNAGQFAKDMRGKVPPAAFASPEAGAGVRAAESDGGSLQATYKAFTDEVSEPGERDFSNYPAAWGEIRTASRYGFVEHQRPPFDFSQPPVTGRRVGILELPADTELHTGQAGISVRRVAHYKRNGVMISPVVYKVGRQYWVADGHHRLAAILPAVRRGERRLHVEVVQFD